MRFFVRFSTTLAIAAAAVAFGPGTAARAAPTSVDAPRISWAYTDSANPNTSYADPAGDAPLGAWRDGDNRLHVSRVYVTFDIGAVLGKHIVMAKLSVPETQATDCAHRQIDVWATTEKARPTWRHPARELVKLGTLGPIGQCPATGPDTVLDLIDVVNRAVAAGVQLPSRVSFELRLPAPVERDVSLGRHVDAPHLYLAHNAAPAAPGLLYNGQRPCATEAPYPFVGGLTPDLQAQVHDTDEGDTDLSAEFAIWPVDQPEQRTTMTRQLVTNGNLANVNPPAGTLVDGTTYAWQARASDGVETSPWSRTCYFIADATAPAAAPTVASPNYPSHTTLYPGGVPIIFDLGANGVTDVIGYQFSWTGSFTPIPYTTDANGVAVLADPFSLPNVVRADQLGGPATMTLSPPSSGMVQLSVRSFDRALNFSTVTSYRLLLDNTWPTVTGPDAPIVGTPFQVTFTPGPNTGTVVDYVYSVAGGPEQTVAAGPDGTATVEVTATKVNRFLITVYSRSANGWISPKAQWSRFLTTAPSVTSDIYPEQNFGGGVGITGTFTFAPRMPGVVVSYVYKFDTGPETTIAAGPDGTASVQWTPSTGGGHSVQVRAITADGTQSNQKQYIFNVNFS